MVSFGLPVILGGLVPMPPEQRAPKGCFITAFPKFYSLCWCVYCPLLLFVLSDASELYRLPTLCFESGLLLL